LEANSGDCEGFDGQFGALSVDSIVSMLVQNAGQVASRAVLASSSPGGADPLDGIILDSADANAVAMSIDTFSPVWERQDSDPTEIIGYAPLKATIVSGLSGLSNDALDHVTSVLDDARGIVIANVQDRVVDAAVAMGELAPEYHLDDAETAGAIVYGSLGTDAIFGTDNADVLLGGAGDDILFSGNAADVLIGGLGSDSFVFTSLDSEEIILQGNNEDDRLYISAELLGFDVETGIDFFPLLGGMISDVEEPDMDEDEGANYVFTQTKYTAVSEWETTPTRVFSDIGQDIVYNLEYDLFTDHLEIIYTAWGEEEMIGQLMIRIDNFEVGDYGIQLYDEPFDFTTETGIDEEVLEDHNAMVDYLTSNGDLLTFTTGTGGTWEVV
jgi:hypothetical protein